MAQRYGILFPPAASGLPVQQLGGFGIDHALRMRNTNSAASRALCSSTSPVSRTRFGISMADSGSVHSSTSASPADSFASALRAFSAGSGHLRPRRLRTDSAMGSASREQ